MTARDVIAGLVAEWRLRAESRDPCERKTLRECADRLESTLAQPSGEAVAGWLVEWNCNGIGAATSAAKAFTAAEEAEAREYHAWRDIAPDYNPARLSPLYTTPPAPLGGLTEGAERKDAEQEYTVSAFDYERDPVGSRDWTLFWKGWQARARRLTAPRAEGVDAETARMLVEVVEGRGCLRWASNSGVRLKDTPEWVAFYNATKAALTAAAPKVAGPQEDAVATSIGQWATALAEVDANEGRWATCSGCYESIEGWPAPGYPFSAMLGCTLGAGCHECGGLGAVWDQADYAALADAAAPQAEAREVTPAMLDNRLEEMAEEYEWRGDDGDHTPTEGERAMLIDFAHGIMADEDFVALARAHFAQPAAQGGDGVELQRYRDALEWIARVNACDYEYQRKARAALAPQRSENGNG